METKILEFLKSNPCKTTAYIARHCVYKEQYDEDEAHFNNNFRLYPGRHSVSGVYYHLKKMQNQGLIEQIDRGIWKLKN